MIFCRKLKGQLDFAEQRVTALEKENAWLLELLAKNLPAQPAISAESEDPLPALGAQLLPLGPVREKKPTPVDPEPRRLTALEVIDRAMAHRNKVHGVRKKA